jgi:hypothetical protein
MGEAELVGTRRPLKLGLIGARPTRLVTLALRPSGVGDWVRVEGGVVVMLPGRRRVRVDRDAGWGGCDGPQRCRARGPSRPPRWRGLPDGP